MRKNIPEKVTVDGDQTTHEHESYGLLSFSRVRCQPAANLFGSSIKSSDTIMLRINKAQRVRSINNDHFFGRDEIVEVEMSPNQFAEAISALNQGSGIPVTIRSIGHEQMSDCPSNDVRKVFESEFRDHIKEITQKMTELQKSVSELMDKKTILKGDREKIVALTDSIVREVRQNIPYIQSQFNESCDKTVTEAKCEIDAVILHHIVEAGLKSILEQAKVSSNNLIKCADVKEISAGEGETNQA